MFEEVFEELKNIYKDNKYAINIIILVALIVAILLSLPKYLLILLVALAIIALINPKIRNKVDEVEIRLKQDKEDV